MKIVFSVLLLAAVVAQATATTAEEDLLGLLPGQSKPTSYRQYAGYLSVSDSSDAEYYYWHSESEGSVDEDPLVLWLNGGPGCSSVSGYFTENGPLTPTKNGKMINNPFAWNKVANVLWIESPIGVGFSRSSKAEDYNQDDASTAKGNFAALQSFLKKFPHFKGRDFYIFGESYAGHYIPTLVDLILENERAGISLGVNLKGFGAGNPLTYEPADFNAPMPFFRQHALISPETYNAAYKACGGNFANNNDAECVRLVNKANKEMGDRIDPYDVLTDVCLDGQIRAENEAHRMRRLQSGISELTPPCIDEYTGKYLNREEVKQAIHADPSIKWVECSDTVNYTFSHASMLPLYQKFMNQTDMRILVYSGDIDSVLPFTGTQEWIADLNRPVKQPWTQWLDSTGQTGGYKVEYDRMTFITIRGAGHMVPEFRPQRAIDFFSRFLANKPI